MVQETFDLLYPCSTVWSPLDPPSPTNALILLNCPIVDSSIRPPSEVAGRGFRRTPLYCHPPLKIKIERSMEGVRCKKQCTAVMCLRINPFFGCQISHACGARCKRDFKGILSFRGVA